jgi:decaprenylphospho-beta-D-ribofuranose 2-oxidase
MMKTAKMLLSGWGNYKPIECEVFLPNQINLLYHEIEEMKQSCYISRGMECSYGDSAVNTMGAVILHEQLGRIISFDKKTGVLTCEAGMTLEDILSVFVPRGYFLPVTPGTKFVTVGGAIPRMCTEKTTTAMDPSVIS